MPARGSSAGNYCCKNMANSTCAWKKLFFYWSHIQFKTMYRIQHLILDESWSKNLATPLPMTFPAFGHLAKTHLEVLKNLGWAPSNIMNRNEKTKTRWNCDFANVFFKNKLLFSKITLHSIQFAPVIYFPNFLQLFFKK